MLVRNLGLATSELVLILVTPLANALVEKQRAALVDNHKSGCPWKSKQCDGT